MKDNSARAVRPSNRAASLRGYKAVAVFRRRRLFSRNTFIAFNKETPEALKAVLMSLLLLR